MGSKNYYFSKLISSFFQQPLLIYKMIIIKFCGKEFQISTSTDDEEINNEKEDGLMTDGEIPKTIGELRDLIANKTGCDQSTMKLLRKGFFKSIKLFKILIFSGKFIVMPLDEPIENLKFKDKEKIMVIGASKKDSGFELLVAYEKNNLPKLSDLYKNIDQDLTELERNFLQGKLYYYRCFLNHNFR
jgi:hypothetical protein